MIRLSISEEYKSVEFEIPEFLDFTLDKELTNYLSRLSFEYRLIRLATFQFRCYIRKYPKGVELTSEMGLEHDLFPSQQEMTSLWQGNGMYRYPGGKPAFLLLYEEAYKSIRL
jgi:hypothetical protein